MDLAGNKSEQNFNTTIPWIYARALIFKQSNKEQNLQVRIAR